MLYGPKEIYVCIYVILPEQFPRRYFMLIIHFASFSHIQAPYALAKAV